MQQDGDQLRENRKDEHVRLALEQNRGIYSHFDEISFVHHSFVEMKVQDVDLSVKTPNLQLNTPIYINAMTGGSEKTGKINAALAEVASTTGMAMAVGSQHAGLRNERVQDTYKVVRKFNPKGIVFANVGAGTPLEFAQGAVEMLEANALQIHVNVPQELVMPEGERDFTGWLKGIEEIVSAISVPVIVKEVGFGMSQETIEALKNVGVRYVDVSGRGGTNFIGIENSRRRLGEYNYLQNWGQTTPISLLEGQKFMGELTVFASGGIRNPLDVAKSLALGAKACGIAGPILKLVHESGVEGAIEEMQRWHEQLKTIMTLVGAKTPGELAKRSIVIKGELREWCELRGIDVRPIARRGNPY